MANTVTVYRYELWDSRQRAFRVAETRATREFIARVDGRLVAGSECEVDAALVSSDGMLVRWPSQGSC